MKAFRALCIDDANQPASLPPNQRVVEGQIYTVIEIAHMQLQGVQGFKLEEINSRFPYEYFKASRFVPLTEESITEKEYESEERSIKY